MYVCRCVCIYIYKHVHSNSYLCFSIHPSLHPSIHSSIHASIFSSLHAMHHPSMNPSIDSCIHALSPWFSHACLYMHMGMGLPNTYMLSGPGPLPEPGPPGRPCSQQSRATGTNPRKPEGGMTMENDPSQCFFTGAENCIRAGTGPPFARRKEQRHILYHNEHVTMTSLLTSGGNHTIAL